MSSFVDERNRELETVHATIEDFCKTYDLPLSAVIAFCELANTAFNAGFFYAKKKKTDDG